MKKLVLPFLIMSFLVSYSQSDDLDKILEEGQMLYRLESASWKSTDHFLESFGNKIDSVGGYLSYESEGNTIAIFYAEDNDKILARYLFTGFKENMTVEVDTLNEVSSELEKDLMIIREDAENQLNQNKGDFFSYYQNCSFNIIPVISEDQRRVFIITASQVNSTVVLGNDYLLTYDKKNRLTKREKIHNNIIQFPSKYSDSEGKMEESFHSHVLSDYINSTDICTLLLYRDFVDWKKHYVMSKKYVTIFDLDSEKLFSMTTKAWRKIAKSAD